MRCWPVGRGSKSRRPGPKWRRRRRRSQLAAACRFRLTCLPWGRNNNITKKPLPRHFLSRHFLRCPAGTLDFFAVHNILTLASNLSLEVWSSCRGGCRCSKTFFFFGFTELHEKYFIITKPAVNAQYCFYSNTSCQTILLLLYCFLLFHIG